MVPFLCQVTAVRDRAFSKSGFATQPSFLLFFLFSLTKRNQSLGKSGRETSTRSELLSFSAHSRLVLGLFLFVATRAKVDSRGPLIKLLHVQLLFSDPKTMVTLVKVLLN